MYIYLLKDGKIYQYELPSKVEGSLLFPFGEDEELSIVVEAMNGNWVLKSNVLVQFILNTQVAEFAMVMPDAVYQVAVKGNQQLLMLYCEEKNNLEINNYDIQSINEIRIGSNDSCHICYKTNDSIRDLHAVLKKENDSWYIFTENEVYVNRKIISQKLLLRSGDIIFIDGLKILFLGNFININNLNNRIIINGLSMLQKNNIDNSNYDQLEDEVIETHLYSDNDYFYKTPRLRLTLKEAEVTIDSPPGNQEKKDDLPFILSLGTSTTMLITSFIRLYDVYTQIDAGTRTVKESLSQIIMSVSMILFSFLVPKITKTYQKKTAHKRELFRQEKYSKYLESKQNEINDILLNEKAAMNQLYPRVDTCYSIIDTANKRELWNKNDTDEDFLTVRLGTGKLNSKLVVMGPEKKFTLDEDSMIDAAINVINSGKYLEDVPITLSLRDNRIISFICECNFSNEMRDSIMVQLLSSTSAMDLKIVIFTSKDNEEYYSYFKNLPYCFNDDRSVRFFATDEEERKNICNYLEQVVNDRNVEEGKSEYVTSKCSPFYLIITDDYFKFSDTELVKKILTAKNNIGFSILIWEESIRELPNDCQKFVNIHDNEGCIFDKDLSNDAQLIFKPEYLSNIDMRQLTLKLSNIPLPIQDADSELPDSLNFLEMFNVGKIEQLNLLNRWQTNNPILSLKTQVGVRKSGESFYLDLHEKHHGPHGLVAGSTGSGKSEFIITYILSMIINYHPDEVQFVLIDYKGGGLAGAFENKETGLIIPHLAGVITNLDDSEVNRSMVSIDSELKRRQRVFNAVRDRLGESTIDIYKYQKFYREKLVDEPISHLFIISDEFAELKSQKPEFMAQLISTARIGRSLGVHLILATQKPSGVVNEQIWSNTRFRVCLKVQTKGDSMDMLKRPEAASLKQAGRFYLQVGYDELFELGQSGYSGAKYKPSDRIIRKVDTSINFIDNIGNIYKTIDDIKDDKKDSSSELGDQLTNIVKYIYEISQNEGIHVRKMWKDPIPETIMYNEIVDKYTYSKSNEIIEGVIGEYDDPVKQEQGLLKLNLTNFGNTIIYGIPGAGKENLIYNMVYSLSNNYSPEDINIYILDFGSETLNMFNKFPQVGDVVLSDNQDKIFNLINLLVKEFETRKNICSEFGGNYVDYCKLSGNKIPLITIIINNYEVMIETYKRIGEYFATLIRDGQKYGIDFIITTTLTNAFSMRAAQSFQTKICLQLADFGGYRDILGAPRGMVPKKCFGRGIIKNEFGVYEFQTTKICEKENLINFVKEEAAKLKEIYPESVKRIPVLPDVVTLSDVLFELKDLKTIPIGIEKNSLEVYVYDFEQNNANIICGEELEPNIDFLYAISKEFKRLSDVRLIVIDLLDIYKKNLGEFEVYNSNFDNVIKGIHDNIAKENQSNVKTIYMFIGIGLLKSKLSENIVPIYEEMFKNLKNYQKSIFILSDNYESYKKFQLETWYRDVVDNQYGIWIGPNVDRQLSITCKTFTTNDKAVMFNNIGYPIYKCAHMIVKLVVDKDDGGENE